MMNTLNTENPIEKPFRKTGDPVDLTSESPLHPRRKSRRIMVGRWAGARPSPCSR